MVFLRLGQRCFSGLHVFPSQGKEKNCMANTNWRLSRKAITAAIVTVLIATFTTLAVAQRENAQAIFAAAPKLNTSVDGIHAFPATPNGFNFLTATNRELLSYGLPQRPDQATDAKGYEH